jgi:hypothetical protein
MTEQYEVLVGIDWVTQSQRVCVGSGPGEVFEEWDVEHDAGAIARLSTVCSVLVVWPTGLQQASGFRARAYSTTMRPAPITPDSGPEVTTMAVHHAASLGPVAPGAHGHARQPPALRSKVSSRTSRACPYPPLP